MAELTPQRREQIIRLLETRNDHLPEARSRSWVGRHSSNPPPSGFVDSTIAPSVCPTCEGVDPHCHHCRGRGEIEIARDQDPYRKTDKVMPYGLNETAREHRQAIDQAIHVAEREAARLWGIRPQSAGDELEQANRHGYTWERERARMYKHHDYAALDHALEQLRDHNASLAGLVIAVHTNELYDISATVAAAVELALAYINQHMPDPIRAPDTNKHPALIRRDQRTAA